MTIEPPIKANCSTEMNPTERDAALKLVGYELRKGSTVEAAARKYDLPLSVAQKATQPRRRRQRRVILSHDLSPEEVEVLRCEIEGVKSWLRSLEGTVIEMIDHLPATPQLSSISVETPQRAAAPMQS